MKKLAPNPIVACVERELKSAGFSKKSGTWYQDQGETWALVNLQKSQYGQQYYVNVGLELKVLEQTPRLQESQWAISLRANFLPGVDDGRLKTLLDAEDTSVDAAERDTELGDFVRRRLLPFMGGLKTNDDLREAIARGLLVHGLVRPEVKRALAMS